MEIKYFNRGEDRVEVEKVYGQKAIKWLYDSSLGRLMASLLVRPWLSKLYGRFQDMRWSQRKIAPFVEEYEIPMDEFVDENYKSFNQFFIRKFKEGMRPFDERPTMMPAFCEARYFGHDQIDDTTTIPVKGTYLRPRDLVASEKWAPYFEGGPFLVARLCPVDYHCFHFPDSGRVLDSYRVSGILHSVNPLALEKRPDIFIVNERQVSILETEHFGKLAYIEVGAICVGKIHQTYAGPEFRRGGEKGHFLFGGSTVIVLGEKGKWSPTEDILENTKNSQEVYVKLGQELARSIPDEKHL
jgi:phosphatidylserine decarboxylase